MSRYSHIFAMAGADENGVIDHRDALDRANRDELYAFAKSRGVAEIDEKMYMGPYAAIMMRKILRRHGLVSVESAGQHLAPSIAKPPENAMMADDLAEREARAAVPLPPREDPPEVDIKSLPMGKLKALAKQRGIKQARTDNRETLLAKLNGKSHAA